MNINKLITDLQVCADDDILCTACDRYYEMKEKGGTADCVNQLLLDAAEALEKMPRTIPMCGRKENKMKVKVMLDPGAKMPTRAHETDAGLDLYSTIDTVLPVNSVCTDGCVCIDTGVHIEIPAGYVGMIKSKSGLNVNFGVTSEGVIDAGYTGSIMVKLYNHGKVPVQIEKGQKISQLVILPIITPELELVDSLEETERGTGGFGSTGRF